MDGESSQNYNYIKGLMQLLREKGLNLQVLLRT